MPINSASTFLINTHIIFVILNGIVLFFILFRPKGTPRHIWTGKAFGVTLALSLLPVCLLQFYQLYTNDPGFIFSNQSFKLKVGVLISFMVLMDFILGMWVLGALRFKKHLASLLLLNLIFLLIFIVSFSNASELPSRHYSIAFFLTLDYSLSLIPFFGRKMIKVPIKSLHSFFMYSVVWLSFFSLISSSFSNRVLGHYAYLVFYNPYLYLIIILLKINRLSKAFAVQSAVLKHLDT